MSAAERPDGDAGARPPFPPTGAAARAFAREWEDGWNSHDLDRILSHYHSDVRFRSRKARALTGTGEIVGHDALRAYWARALAAQPDLAFAVTDVFAGHGMIVITYRNHRDVVAAEALWFDAEGRVVAGGACHPPDAA